MEQLQMYSDVVLADNPIGFWKFSERKGSKIAKNYGSAESVLDGYIAKYL